MAAEVSRRSGPGYKTTRAADHPARSGGSDAHAGKSRSCSTRLGKHHQPAQRHAEASFAAVDADVEVSAVSRTTTTNLDDIESESATDGGFHQTKTVPTATTQRYGGGRDTASTTATHVDAAEYRATSEPVANAGRNVGSKSGTGPEPGTSDAAADPATAAAATTATAVVQTSSAIVETATAAAVGGGAAATTTAAIPAAVRGSLVSAKAAGHQAAAHELQLVSGTTVSSDAGAEADAATSAVSAGRDGTTSGRDIGSTAAAAEESAADQESAAESVVEAVT
jgi:hypothetical protein